MNGRGEDGPILRDLAAQYAEIALQPIQDERRALWRDHNSLIKTRVPIICSWYWGSILADSLLAGECRCADPANRGYELWLRNMIYHAALGDDTVQEPWITVRAAHRVPPACRDGNVWGIPYKYTRDPATGAWLIAPAIRNQADAAGLVATPHAIDEEETARRVARLQEAIGDALTINVDRSPFYQCYGGSDLCEATGYLLGIGNLMVDLLDQPDLVRTVVQFMRDAVLAQYEQAEAAGDWSLTNNFNMGMPYAHELPDPQPNCHGVSRKQLWFFTCAQAFTLVSPRMFYDFMLQYQLPIVEQFGLASYACCEDVTHKIPMLRKIPNLRRIGVTPVSNVRKCAEQIGRDYVIGWKPNPAMICADFDPPYIRRAIREGLEAARGCAIDVMLKDVSTVQEQPERLKIWTEIVREVAAAYQLLAIEEETPDALPPHAGDPHVGHLALLRRAPSETRSRPT